MEITNKLFQESSSMIPYGKLEQGIKAIAPFDNTICLDYTNVAVAAFAIFTVVVVTAAITTKCVKSNIANRTQKATSDQHFNPRTRSIFEQQFGPGGTFDQIFGRGGIFEQQFGPGGTFDQVFGNRRAKRF